MSKSPITDAFVAQHVMVRVADDPFETLASVRKVLIEYARLARQFESERRDLTAALQAISDSWPDHGSNTDNHMADAMAAKARAALAKLKG